MLYIGGGAVCGSALIGVTSRYAYLVHTTVFLSISICSVVSLFAFRRRNHRLLLFSTAFIFFCINAYLRLPTPNPKIESLINRDEPLLFEGKICGSIFRYPKLPEETDTERFSCFFELNWYESEGRRRYIDAYLLLRFRLRSGIEPLCGDVIRTYGSLRPVRKGSKLCYEGVDGILIARLHDFVSLRRKGSGSTLSDIRASFARKLDGVFGKDVEAAAFARALLLGEQYAIPYRVRLVFQKTGVSHILALSGIHLAILTLLAGFAFRLLFFPKKRYVVLVVVIILNFFYFLVGGMRPSLFRAFVVLLIYYGGILTGRKREGFNSIGAAVAILLLIFPFDALTVSFQLTFVTFLGVVLLCPPFMDYIETRKFILQLKGYSPDYIPLRERAFWFVFVTLYLSATSWFSSQPLIGLYFGIIPYGTLIANMAIFPFFLLALICIMLIFPLLILSPLFAYPFVVVFASVYHIITFITYAIADAGLYTFLPNRYLPAFNPAVLLFYGVIVLIGVRVRGHLLWLKARHLVLLALFICSVWMVSGRVVDKPPDIKMDTVEFLPVGQGMAVLMNIDGNIILYDCGSVSYAERTGTFVAEYLHRRGIRHLDVLILSHPHSDHINGVRELAERLSIGKVVISRWFKDNPSGRELLLFFKERRIDVCDVVASAEVGGSIRVVAPITDSLFGRGLSDNDLSLVLLVRLGDNTKVLLTGDLEERGTAVLLLAGVDVRCDIMQLPHHGRKNILLREFVNVSGAEKFIISGSRRRLEGVKDGKIYTTDDCGAITILSDGTITTLP